VRAAAHAVVLCIMCMTAIVGRDGPGYPLWLFLLNTSHRNCQHFPYLSPAMPLFKRKEGNLIPPVKTDSPSSRTTGGSSTTLRSPYHSNASTYVPSRDGDLYQNPTSKSDSYIPSENDYAPRDKYSRSNGVGDIYSRGTAELDQDRKELFSGYNAQKAGSGRFFDGPQPGSDPPPGEENDEDVEGIKQQTRFIKQDSVNTTRNALRLAREAEDTARNTLMKLGDQSGTIFHIS
jgi:protein transport protein SEC9